MVCELPEADLMGDQDWVGAFFSQLTVPDARSVMVFFQSSEEEKLITVNSDFELMKVEELQELFADEEPHWRSMKVGALAPYIKAVRPYRLSGTS